MKKLIVFAATPGFLIAQMAQMHAAGADVRLAATFHESSLRLLVTGDVRPGATYVIETTSSLGADAPWLVVEPVQAASNAILRELPAPSDQAAFFRVRLPRPALFRVEPAVSPAAGGTTLYIIGQMLGTNGQVRIGGQTVPVETVQEGSIYRCVAPPLPEGTYDVEWIEGGRVVTDWRRNLTITELLSARQRLMEPPAEPPASPEWARRSKRGANAVPRVGGPLPGAGIVSARVASNPGRWLKGALNAAQLTCSEVVVLPATGEVQLRECDVVVPGVGLDFCFVRTYRSRTGRTTPMGHNWDHSYNLYIEAEGDDVAVCDGTGRRDVLFRQADGTFSRDEFFWHGRWDDATGNFILEFPGKGFWEFYHFNVRPAGGRIARIADANGNELQFTYDLQARLTEVVDTLGRTFTFEYTPDGFLRSLRDFTGRRWIYTYHSDRSAGGGPGDLASVTTPPVTGMPTGNDFPQGKTTSYTYTKGAADDRLNHNLLTITDAKGQTWLQVTYHTNTSPSELDFDAVASVQRGIEKKDIWRVALAASPTNRYAVVRAIVRDGVGNVTEYYYDSLNRPVIIRDFTGRSNVQQPVTDVANRPTGKLRAEDPDYYETAFEWNNDSLLTRYLWPDGDEIRCVYERDFDPAANPRNKGDLRVWRVAKALAEMDEDDKGSAEALLGLEGRVWRFEHDPRFGSPIRRVKAEMYSEDIRFTYSPAAAFKAGGALSNPKNAVLYEAYTRFKRGGALAEPRNAVLFEAGGKPLYDWHEELSFAGTGFELDRMRHGLVLRNVEGIDGETETIQCAYTRVTDPRGVVTTATYDERGNRTQVRCADPVSGVTQLDCAYDARGRLTRCVHPADAEGRRRQDTFSYYTNGPMAGYLATARCDDGGLSLTTTFEYDARGNLTRCVNPRGHDTLWTYNALDQVVLVQSPPAGGVQRVTTRFFYDANDNLVQVDRENRDAAGVLHSTNPWWTSRVQYDVLDRPGLVSYEVSGGGELSPGSPAESSLTYRLSWDANDNLIRIEGPRAVSGQDPHQQTVFTYDERGLLFTAVEAPGTGLSATNRRDYDAKGDLRRSSRFDASTSKQTSVERHFRQPVRVTDAAGNLTLFSYDRAGNLVRIRHLGETNDVPGSAGNRRLAETRLDYDALGRLVRWRDSFFDIFTQEPIGDGESTHTFAYAPNGQLISETDDLGRTTRYTYDTAGRCVAITDPATNRVEFTYDANGNVTLIRQVDRSDLGGPEQVFLSHFTYDALDRLLTSADNVGNNERYAYDSRDNLVRVTDPRGNDTCYEYDGLSRRRGAITYVGPCDAGVVLSTTHVEYRDTRLTGWTDGNSNVTRYAYDSLDRCVAVTNADFTVSQMAYDAFGNLAQIRDPNGTVVTCTYDALDRCVRRDITPGPGVADTTTFETFAYDGRSLLVLASNNVSRATFTWDSRAQPQKAGQDEFFSALTYDTVGNPKSLTLPSGRVLTATHDALNRVSTLNLVEGGRVTQLASFAYEGPDRLGRITRPNGINTRINWNGTLNPANQPGDFGWQQVARINHQRAQGGAVIDQRGYAYDRNQNKTVRAQLAPFVQGGPLLTNRWETDALDRLVQSLRQTGAGQFLRQYQLDANGNRQVVIEDGTAQLYTMDATLPEPADFQMNQYTLTPFGAFQYDANGNRVRATTLAGELIYQYDYADRLVAVQRLEGGLFTPVVSFTYDALGRCVTRTTYPPAPLAPQTTRFIYHPVDDTVVEEWKDGVLHLTHATPKGESYRKDITVRTTRAEITASGQVRYVLCDDLGNALALTDAAGNVLERYDYDDFGQPRFLDAKGEPLLGDDGLPVNASPAGLDWLYRGAYWNAALGLHEAVSVGTCDLPADFDPFNAAPLSGMKIEGGMPNRISMNVTVGRQTQGATFGERMANSKKTKQWLPSNFRLRIDGLEEPCSRNHRTPASGHKSIGEITLRGDMRDGRKHIGNVKYEEISFRKLLDRGEAGDNVGLLLRAISNVLKTKHDTVKNSIANIR